MVRGLAVCVACATAFVPAAVGGTLPRDKLALMPLPKEMLGRAAVGLPLQQDSGVVTNADAAEDANGNVSARKLAGLGRLTGYSLDYGSGVPTGRGLSEVQTMVELYKDPAAARKGMEFWRRDETKVGAFRSVGVAVTVKAFATPPVGEEHFAFAGKATLKGKATIYGVDEFFRVGELVAEVSVAGGSPGPVDRLAAPLARKLEARIKLLLAGKLSAAPVPLPAEQRPGPPPHGPNLSSLALRPSDLGKGRVTHQGYQLDKDLSPISEYERTMSPAGNLATLDEEVMLFHSPTEASYAVAFLANALSSNEVMRQSGFRSFRATPVRVAAGDEARAAVAVVGLSGGRTVYEGFVVMRVGATVEFITIGSPSRLLPSAVRQVARIAADRATTGLHKQTS